MTGVYLRGRSASSHVSKLDGVDFHDLEDAAGLWRSQKQMPKTFAAASQPPSLHPSPRLEPVLHYAEVAAAAARWGLFPTSNHSLQEQRKDGFGDALQSSCFSGPTASSAGKGEAQREGGGSSWEGGEGERKSGREVPEQFHSKGSV